MRRIRKKKGQSTLEYVVVFSVVVLALAAAAYTAIRPAVQNLMDKTGERITAEGDKIMPEE